MQMVVCLIGQFSRWLISSPLLSIPCAGNTAKCNYVVNGDHCLYFDNWSSDIRVTGGACINTRDGVKVNNGRRCVFLT